MCATRGLSVDATCGSDLTGRRTRWVVAEASDIGERRRAREMDRLRREAEAIARLLRQARLDGVREDIEAAKARLAEAEARLESKHSRSE